VLLHLRYIGRAIDLDLDLIDVQRVLQAILRRGRRDKDHVISIAEPRRAFGLQGAHDAEELIIDADRLPNGVNARRGEEIVPHGLADPGDRRSSELTAGTEPG